MLQKKWTKKYVPNGGGLMVMNPMVEILKKNHQQKHEHQGKDDDDDRGNFSGIPILGSLWDVQGKIPCGSGNFYQAPSENEGIIL